jgi:hypothetical protein
MAPEWQTASEGLEAGAPIFDGTDPHIAIDAALNRGFLAVKDCPFSFATDGFNVPAIWANYLTTTDAQAILYKPGSVYSVSPDYDSIKEALFQANAENGVVMAFGYWYDEFNIAAMTPIARGIVPVPTASAIDRHAYTPDEAQVNRWELGISWGYVDIRFTFPSWSDGDRRRTPSPDIVTFPDRSRRRFQAALSRNLERVCRSGWRPRTSSRPPTRCGRTSPSRSPARNPCRVRRDIARFPLPR